MRDNPKRRRCFSLLQCALCILLLAGLAASVPGARTVTLNLAFSFGNKADDTIQRQAEFASSQEGDTVLALVASGRAFASENVTGFTTNEYLLRVNQSAETNRFLLVFTKGTNQTIREKLQLVGNRKVPSTRFGNLNVTASSAFTLFLRLEYESLNIVSRARLAAGNHEFVIRNEGDDSEGRTKIAVEVIR